MAGRQFNEQKVADQLIDELRDFSDGLLEESRQYYEDLVSRADPIDKERVRRMAERNLRSSGDFADQINDTAAKRIRGQSE